MSEPAMSKVQIYVSNLPAGSNSDRLHAAFAQFGPIDDAFVPQRKRFGFVTFVNAEDATKALSMNDQPLDNQANGEAVSVSVAREKVPEKEAEKKAAKAAKARQPKKNNASKKSENEDSSEKNGRKRRAKKAPGGGAAKPPSAEVPGLQPDGADQGLLQERKAKYTEELPAKCLLLGLAHRESELASAK